MSIIKDRFEEIHEFGSLDAEACLVAESLSNEFFIALTNAESNNRPEREEKLISLAEILIADVQAYIKKEAGNDKK
jgi:hypothetical protein